jgi:hypothetical protein
MGARELLGPGEVVGHQAGGPIATLTIDMDPTGAAGGTQPPGDGIANIINPPVNPFISDVPLDLCGVGEVHPGCTGANAKTDTENVQMGQAESCIRVDGVGTSFDVDVVVLGYPNSPNTGTGESAVGYDVEINAPAGFLNATGSISGSALVPSLKTLITADPQSSGCSNLLEPYGFPIPITPGAGTSFNVPCIDLGGPTDETDENIDGEENSDGYLTRVTLTTTNAGPAIVPLSLSSPSSFVVDSSGPVPITTVSGGNVAIGMDCPLAADVEKQNLLAERDLSSPGGWLNDTDIAVSEQAFVKVTQDLHNLGPNPSVQVLDIKKIDCPHPTDPDDFVYAGSTAPPFPTHCSWQIDADVIEVEVHEGVNYFLKEDDNPVDGYCDPPYIALAAFSPAAADEQVDIADGRLEGMGVDDCIVAESTDGAYKEVGIKKVITLPESSEVLDYSTADLHCTGPSTHVFNIQDDITVIDEGVVDSDLLNNHDSTNVTVNCIATSDVAVASVDILGLDLNGDTTLDLPRPTGKLTGDGIDNDDDGMEDGSGPNPGGGDCDDGIDNGDGDGLIDDLDPECQDFIDEDHFDGADNDGDTSVDEDDAHIPAMISEDGFRDDGLSWTFDSALATPMIMHVEKTLANLGPYGPVDVSVFNAGSGMISPGLPGPLGTVPANCSLIMIDADYYDPTADEGAGANSCSNGVDDDGDSPLIDVTDPDCWDPVTLPLGSTAVQEKWILNCGPSPYYYVNDDKWSPPRPGHPLDITPGGDLDSDEDPFDGTNQDDYHTEFAEDAGNVANDGSCSD